MAKKITNVSQATLMKKQMRQAGFLFIFFIFQNTDEATFFRV